MTHTPWTRAARLSAAAVLCIALAGCTGQPADGPSDAPNGGSSEVPAANQSAASTPDEVTFIADGSAQDNLPLFDKVTRAVWAGPEQVSGRAYIDALVQAGFDKSAMQVTPDRTTVNNPAESILFSVRWEQQCLIGQVGPSTGEPVTTVVDVTEDELCLIGNTRTIDW